MFHSVRKALFRLNNTFRSNDNNNNYIFRSARKRFHDINISSNYDIIPFSYSYRKTYEIIYFVFHFIITQDKKIAVCTREASNYYLFYGVNFLVVVVRT
jgi:hypothetical protein